MEKIEQANQEALKRILAGDPILVDVVPAAQAISELTDRVILHAGPPIGWERMCGPMRGAVTGIAVSEGWAATLKDAETKAAAGAFAFHPNHHFGAVGPMTGMTTKSQPLLVVENRAFGNRAYCAINEGLGKVMRFGGNDAEVLDRLRWIRDVLGPALGRALREIGSVSLKPLIARGSTMGDEMHQRNVACSSLLLRQLAPALARTSKVGSELVECLGFMGRNDQFFLNIGMAMGKSMADPARNIEGSSVVTAMSRNGTDFGLRVSGTGDRWFTAPVEMPVGLYFPGFSEKDANPDMGDSAIVETVGLGAFAMAAAPAVVGYIGAGRASEAAAYTRAMAEIAVGSNPAWTIPALDHAGVPTGIDIRLVVETGVTPAINTGIAHREPGVGQVGAGVAKAPLHCFEQALVAFAHTLGRRMSVILNEVRRGAYLDSIVLMRMSRQIAAMPGVEEAGLMIGTPANKEILREAGVLGAQGEAAEAGDLILALKAADAAAGASALAQANRLLDQPGATGGSSGLSVVRTVRAAVNQLPGANLALISVPGDFAAAEARKALRLGLNVMIFSDNVPIAEEAALKREARELGLLVLGPDCGTTIIGGTPIAFSNAVPRGDIGIIGASGTGIQEVSCLIARAGRGISHAIGTGGRDLKAEVGAITTLMAIDALDADAGTTHIVLISKPPAASVARLVLDRVAASPKSFTICLLGAADLALPKNARLTATLKGAAESAMGRPLAATAIKPVQAEQGRLVRGLFAGGTLCAEAQIVFGQAGLAVSSNVPVPGAAPIGAASGGHVMIDLGDDEFTRGRPHPMIEPSVRDGPLREALADREVGVILLDLVLGYGSHRDPARHLAGALAGARAPLIVASVTGTDGDPQPRAAQVRTLAQAGVLVAESNADAAGIAIAAVR